MEDKVVELLNKLEALATQMAEPALETVVHAIWLKSIVKLGFGFLALAILAALLIYISKMLVRERRMFETENRYEPPLLLVIQGVFAALGGLVSTIAALELLIDSGTWVGAIDPLGRLALSIVN